MVDYYDLNKRLSALKKLTERIEDAYHENSHTDYGKGYVEINFGLNEERNGITWHLNIDRQGQMFYWQSFDSLEELERAVERIWVGVRLMTENEV